MKCSFVLSKDPMPTRQGEMIYIYIYIYIYKGGFTLGFVSKKLGVQNISIMDITFGLKIGPKLEMGFSN